MNSQSADAQKKWHIKKEVSVGDMIAYVFAGAAILLAYGKLDTRVSLLETMIRVQERRDADQDQERHALTDEVNRRLIRIEDKIDRIYTNAHRPTP